MLHRVRHVARTSGGAILMLSGIILLGAALLPGVCWIFAIGIAMVLAGHSLAKRR